MAGNVLTETGTSPDPMTDGKTMQKYKNVTTFMGDGKYKFEMFMVMPDGKAIEGHGVGLHAQNVRGDLGIDGRPGDSSRTPGPAALLPPPPRALVPASLIRSASSIQPLGNVV